MKVFETVFDETETTQEKQPHPLDTVSIFNKLNFNWVNEFVKICKSKQLQQSMHQRLPVNDSLDGRNRKSIDLFELKCVNSGILKAILTTFVQSIACIFTVGIVKSVIGMLASYYSVEFVHEFERLTHEQDNSDRSLMIRMAVSIWLLSTVTGYIEQNL